MQLFRQNQYITQHEQQRRYANTNTGDTALVYQHDSKSGTCCCAIRYVWCSDAIRGATTAEKLRGTKVWVPTPGGARARPKARLGVGCGRGSPLPLWGSGGINSPPPKICENTYAKSCILVTTCSEISCFLKPTAKKLGTNTLLVG